MTLLLGILFACHPDDNTGFSSTGSSTVDPSTLPTGDGSDNGEVEYTGEAPQISYMNGQFVFSDEGNIDLEAHIFVVDPQDDLLNGTIQVRYDWADQSESLELPIDGETVLVETGELTFLIPNVIGTQTYQLYVTVYDEQGNASDEANAAVAPTENN